MRLLGLLLVSFLMIASVYGQSVKTLRESFTLAAKDKGGFHEFSQRIHQIKAQEITPLLKGYQSLSYFLQCRYVLNPYEKWQYFLKGKTLMEDAVKIDPKNTELRWLRYAVQTQLPFFLSYHQHEKEDKKLLMNYLKSNQENDQDLYLRIQRFIQQTAQ